MTAVAERTWSTGEVAEVLGLESSRAATYASRWRRYLDHDHRGAGSPNALRWSARDVVVAALLRDLAPDRSAYITDPWRSRLVDELRRCEWGTETVTASVDRLNLTYRPRWDVVPASARNDRFTPRPAIDATPAVDALAPETTK